jgi:tetratricopeptide (TPR) repeat protein
MSRSRYFGLYQAVCALSVLAAQSSIAQDLPTDRPKVLPGRGSSKEDRNRTEAATLYGLGVLNESKHRLLEALRCYEEACKLDANAAAPRRALVPLYLALDRIEEALTMARRVLEIDPDDWETGTLCARQLRAQSKPKEAAEVLSRAANSARIKEKPDAQAQLWSDLANLEEDIGEWNKAAAALTKLADLLDHPAPLIEIEAVTREEAVSHAAETYENLGRVLLKGGDSAKAVAAFETARKRDPARAGRLALHLAEIHDKAGRPRDALTCLNQYLAGRPSGTEGYEMKIRLMTQLNEADAIVPALQAASRADQHNAALTLLLARELRKAGVLSDAEKIYLQLVKDQGPIPEAYRGLFTLYKEEGQEGGVKALRLLNKSMLLARPDSEPENGAPGRNRPGIGKPSKEETENEAAHCRSMLLILRDDADAVKLLLKAAHELLTPGAFGPPGALGRGRMALCQATRGLLAALAERTRSYEDAEALYRSCLAGPGPREDEHDAYVGLLSVLQKEHKYAEVISLCKQGLEVAHGTNRVVFYEEMRGAYVALGQFPQAIEAAEEAEKLADPANRLFCQSRRVNTLSQAGKHAEAIAACQAMLQEYNQAKTDEDSQAQAKRASNVRAVRLELSQIYNAAHMPEKSDEQLRIILEESPDDETANNNLGFQWAERGINLPEAERMIRKAIARDREIRSTGKAVGLDSDRDNAAYVDSLGWVLFRKGDLKGARAELEKASALPDGEDDPVVWDHLADVLFRSGEKDKATAAWRKSLALFEAGLRPKDDRYQEIQQKLRQTAP